MFRCYDSLPRYPLDRMYFANGLRQYFVDKVMFEALNIIALTLHMYLFL
jgi:hypothetical protein